jgi:hypothetical protein
MMIANFVSWWRWGKVDGNLTAGECNNVEVCYCDEWNDTKTSKTVSTYILGLYSGRREKAREKYYGASHLITSPFTFSTSTSLHLTSKLLRDEVAESMNCIKLPL